MLNVTGEPTRTDPRWSGTAAMGLVVASLRKLVLAPSSSLMARAALLPSRPCTRPNRRLRRRWAAPARCAPPARPISPYWFKREVVRDGDRPCGASSMPSSVSRYASVAGQPMAAALAPRAASFSSVSPSGGDVELGHAAELADLAGDLDVVAGFHVADGLGRVDEHSVRRGAVGWCWCRRRSLRSAGSSRRNRRWRRWRSPRRGC